MKFFTFHFVKKIIFSLAFLALTYSGNAQLTGWQYKDGILAEENSGIQQTQYQVRLSLNTAALIAAGKMNTDGSDIRFSKDCTGSVLNLYEYWIESGINTTATFIWVKIDTLFANSTRLFYLFYGNTTAAATSSFDNTFPPASRLIVTTGSVSLTGVNNFSWFEVQVGASVTVAPNAPLTIKARKIIVAGTINGDGAGFLGGPSATNGSGPGYGSTSPANSGTYGAGGAGYGGIGGNGGGPSGTSYSQTGQPGIIYGTTATDSIDMGSGGGGASAPGGAGGGGVTLNADVMMMAATGVVTMNGAAGVQTVLNGGGGGGAGGGIRIKGNAVSLGGVLRANGGMGGSGAWAGGGGAGGRIKFFYDASITNTSTQAILPGSPGSANSGTLPGTAGDTGTTSQATYISNIPTYTFVPDPVLTASPNPICTGNTVTFTAAPGYSNYDFHVNANSAQSSVSNTYTTNSLSTGDTVSVWVTDVNGCVDTSNNFLVTFYPMPTASAGADITICDGDSATLTASGGATYLWSTGETDAVISVSPSSSATYTVVVANSSGCTDVDSASVSVNPLPVANAGTDQTICLGNSATLTSLGGWTYLWNTGDTSASITVTPSVTTTYSVTVTSVNGCTASDEALVAIDSCLGIASFNNNFMISVFPNPTGGAIEIKSVPITSGIKINNVAIFNIVGEEVYSEKIPVGAGGPAFKSLIINPDIPKGMYFLKITTESGIITKKIIRQ